MTNPILEKIASEVKEEAHKVSQLLTVRYHFWRHRFDRNRRSVDRIGDYIFDFEDRVFGKMEEVEIFLKSISNPIVKIFNHEGHLVASKENNCWTYA